METRQLGNSDLRVSVVGLGCNNFAQFVDGEQTKAVVDAALDAGVTFFDTADVYGKQGGSERLLGELLKGRRERVVLATKFGADMGYGETVPRGSREYVRLALARSLERLQTDWIDLFYYHVPDGVTPVAETLGALQELVAEGTVRAIGVSNFDETMLREAQEHVEASGGAPVSALENALNLLDRAAEETVLPLCREYEIAFVPYFPLAMGLLSGKYRRGQAMPEGRLAQIGRDVTDEQLAQVEALAAFAEQRGRTLLDLAIGWLASAPGVASVIAGATSAEQVRTNAGAGAWRLSKEELRALDTVPV